MIIKLANGIELNALGVKGEKQNIQGFRRDVLSFMLPASVSLDEMDSIFTEENCKSITLITDETEHIHNNYTIRVELKREPVLVTPATETSSEVYETRVTVSMAQMTYAELQLANISKQNAVLEECIVEMAQVVYA